VIYDILGDLSEGPLERPTLDIEDTGNMINASFSSLSESKFLDHINESGSIFLP